MKKKNKHVYFQNLQMLMNLHRWIRKSVKLIKHVNRPYKMALVFKPDFFLAVVTVAVPVPAFLFL